MVPSARSVVSEWQSLAKIQPGDKVEVVDQQMRSYNGKFASFSETGITLMSADKEVTIPKNDVYRVTVVSRGRGRHVLRGLLIGTGIGLGIGAAASAPHSVEGSRAASSADLPSEAAEITCYAPHRIASAIAIAAAIPFGAEGSVLCAAYARLLAS
jgi:hypothetical protein